MHFRQWKRREFITLLGGAAAWPLAARAQQAERVRRIAFLHSFAEHDPEVLASVVAFRQGLEALGWIENRNVQLEHRYSAGDVDRIQTYTTEVVRSAPDVIVCSSTPIVAALKQATDTIPIVFSLVNDPVGQGFVATLSRPGGNITGFSFIDFPLIGKWIEMLKEIRHGSNVAFWNAVPTFFTGPVTVSPATLTTPREGSTRPVTTFIRVDLPHPLGPITAMSWPLPTVSGQNRVCVFAIGQAHIAQFDKCRRYR